MFEVFNLVSNQLNSKETSLRKKKRKARKINKTGEFLKMRVKEKSADSVVLLAFSSFLLKEQKQQKKLFFLVLFVFV